MAEEIGESVSVVEDVSNGVTTTLHFQGDQLVVQREYDAKPWLEAAKAARIATAGERWGDGRTVGYLPPAEYGRFLIETRGQSQEEKRKWLKTFFQQKPDLVTFEKYLIK